MERQVIATELQMTCFLLLQYFICCVQIHESLASVDDEGEELERKEKQFPASGAVGGDRRDT